MAAPTLEIKTLGLGLRLSSKGASNRLTNRSLRILFTRASRCKTTSTMLRPRLSKDSSAWESVIGLELHAQIASKSKLFSASKVQFMAPPNSLVSHFDAALPGTLPVLNKRCVEAGVITAIALSCHINKRSLFDRKHYFYADLPSGYQITQQRVPIATDGQLTFTLFDEKRRHDPTRHRVRIKQIQLEQDSGKSLHDDVNHETLVDLNRAGVGLMEIVTEPDLSSALEAAAMVRELQLILQCIGTCDGRMDQGSLRVDANVSVNRPGDPPGVRAEIKNINSIRFVKNAIDFEIARQTELLENGMEVSAETRSYDLKLGETVPMRDKEGKQDYRFMPEPNLPPLILYDNATIHTASDARSVVNIDEVRGRLPELPEAKRQRLVKDYGIRLDSAVKLVNEDGLVNFFEAVISEDRERDPKKVVNWLETELLKSLNDHDLPVFKSPMDPTKLGELHDLMTKGAISANIGKKLMAEIFQGDSRPITQIINEKGWAQITDRQELNQLCEQVLKKDQALVDSYKSGNTRVINRLMGEVQKMTQGRADPVITRDILTDKMTR
ncbi:glutamyl-tRNA(Gln) amidotransferase subunit B, mitochondrial-like [Patiria miniata]|uniref:Glutamyl-tRNA(Gln) amidotransferase subunit B, mitochondrial n=1 Tax=Patiria miniata TaxID=46514 RepID=A0A913ZW12_PATMI|nr:glutamyl-tRNA(Gln) amidotransferase subunit B, mitochondrial-like [Patiria miniata]